MPSLPKRYRRMMHGDSLAIGGRAWEVITVFGHAPEHAALWCESLNVLISGDQVLPRITTNVGVWGNQPEANPLALFLGSMDASRTCPPTRACCPRTIGCSTDCTRASRSCASTTRGASSACEEGCRERPLTAFEALPFLFKRKLDEHQMGFAMGEAIAHLHYLEAEGRVRREVDSAGLRRFRAG